jgi:hypothetical protein
METTATQPETKDETQAKSAKSKGQKPSAPATPIESAAKEISETQAKVDAEVKAFRDAYAAMLAASQAIGSLGLEVLAREVGESVDSNGRPAFAPWHRLLTILAQRKVDFTTHDRLLRIARKAVPAAVAKEKADKFVKNKSRAAFAKASCTLTMNAPAAWEIALGE